EAEVWAKGGARSEPVHDEPGGVRLAVLRVAVADGQLALHAGLELPDQDHGGHAPAARGAGDDAAPVRRGALESVVPAAKAQPRVDEPAALANGIRAAAPRKPALTPRGRDDPLHAVGRRDGSAQLRACPPQ